MKHGSELVSLAIADLFCAFLSMTTEKQFNIPTQPFPSCSSIDQTVRFLTRALQSLEHAPESPDVEKAKVLIEEGIEDVEAYREIHSNMRAWGQGWKDAFLSQNDELSDR